MPDPPVACSLAPADQEQRLREFADLADRALLESTRTPEGARLRLWREPSVEASLARLIEAERRCCSFIEFEVEGGDRELAVEVSGPPPARPLIDRLFELERAAGSRV